MTKYLHRPIDYASTGNYAAPGKPWDGFPSRPAISDGVLIIGAVPNTPIPPSVENYRESLLFDAATVQLHSALRSWKFNATPVNGANGNTQLVAVPATGLAQKILFAIEPDTTHAGNAWWTRSNDGSSWLAKAGMSPTFANLTDAAPGAAGEIMLVDSSTTSVQYSTNYGVAWANVSFGPSACRSVHFALGQYWACNGVQVWTANSIASFASGTAATLPVPGSGALTSVPEFADNGANTICLVGTPTSGVTYPSIYTSTNLGTSWIKAFDLTGATAANLKYDVVRGLFVTWDNAGNVSTSSDGLSWNRVLTTGTTANGLVSGPRTFAIVGSAIAKLWLKTIGGQLVQGVAYSFDLGTSWFVHVFGSNGTPLLQLRAANNRLHALDGFNLWTSEIVAAQDKDF